MTPPFTRRRFTSVLCSSVMLFAASVAAQEKPDAPATTEKTDTEKYQLEYQFKQGDNVTFEIQHDSRITSSAGSRKEIAINKTKTVRTYRVLDVDESGAAQLEMQIDSVFMSAEFEDEDGSQGDPVVFDSKDPSSAKNPKFSEVQESIGKPQAIVTVDKTGRSIGVKNLLKPSQNSKKNAKGNDSETPQKPDSVVIALPQTPVAIGSTWKENFDVFVRNESSLTIKIRMQTIHKLESVDGNKATISYRTVVLTPVEQPSIAGQLIQRELEGKATFDIEHGRLLSREAKLDRTVVGAFGAQSSMQAVARYKETLVPAKAEVATKATTKTVK